MGIHFLWRYGECLYLAAGSIIIDQGRLNKLFDTFTMLESLLRLILMLKLVLKT